METALVMFVHAVEALVFSVFQVPSMPDLILFHPVVAPLLMLFQVVEKNDVTPFHTSVALLLMPVHIPLIQVVK